MELEGKVIQDLPLVEGISKAGNAWKKKEWVLETLGNYPKKVKIHFFGDRADSNRLELGKTYAIGIDIESREFNGRWYTDVSGFSSRLIGEEGASGVVNDPFTPMESQSPASFDSGNVNDDLPF